MTPAFEHHDKIAAVESGTWLRCVGPVKASPDHGRRITLQPGTMLRVRLSVGGGFFEAHFDAGGRLQNVTVFEEWWHNLEIVSGA